MQYHLVAVLLLTGALAAQLYDPDAHQEKTTHGQNNVEIGDVEIKIYTYLIFK